jgi:hypothetical protein
MVDSINERLKSLELQLNEIDSRVELVSEKEKVVESIDSKINDIKLND